MLSHSLTHDGNYFCYWHLVCTVGKAQRFCPLLCTHTIFFQYLPGMLAFTGTLPMHVRESFPKLGDDETRRFFHGSTCYINFFKAKSQAQVFGIWNIFRYIVQRCIKTSAMLMRLRCQLSSESGHAQSLQVFWLHGQAKYPPGIYSVLVFGLVLPMILHELEN